MKDINLTKEEILNRIGYFRNKKNISAYQLGLSLGHSKTYFYRIESGEIQLTIDTLLETLEILEVTTFEFFYPDLSKYETDLSFFNKINRLTNDEKETILAILNIKNKN